MNKYFFDASAIVEIIKDEKLQYKFEKYQFITNSLHMSEVYYYLLRNYNKQTADYLLKSFVFEIVDLSLDTSLKGALFKFENKKVNLSYADCIGYVTSLNNNLTFLTSDKDFIGFNNVEFVK